MDIAFVCQRDCLLWLTAKITKIKSGHSKVNFWNKETDLPSLISEGLLQERFKRLLRSIYPLCRSPNVQPLSLLSASTI